MLKKIFTAFAIFSFLIYTCVAFYILFMRLGGVDRIGQNQFAINLIPFKTIIEYTKGITEGRGHALMNLGGNLLLFFPLGFYMPFFVKNMLKVKTYVIFIAILITSIEIIQLLTGAGSFDIDDFILNLIGAIMGLLICEHTPIRLLFKLQHGIKL